MAFGDPSREDAAADAVPAVGALRIFRGAALVDNHRVALDTAVRVVVADVEGAALSDVIAHVNHGLGGAVVVARPEGEVRSIGDPRVVADRAPRSRVRRGPRRP